MKTKTLAITFACALAAALALAGCASGSMGLDVLDEANGYKITVQNAGKDNVVTGDLKVGLAECVCVSPDLSKGKLHVTLSTEGGTAVIDQDFDGRVLTYIPVSLGDYTLQVTGVGGATGSMTISTWKVADVIKMNSELEKELENTTGESAGLANPWTDDIKTDSEAAMTAGITDFHAPAGNESDLGDAISVTFRAMSGLVEANYEYPAAAMTIRKGTSEIAGENGDVSGDYNEYAHTWTQTIAGYEVTCFGNREGDATKTIWKGDNDMYFSITVEGLGGDSDFGLNAERLGAFISNLA